MVTKLQPQKDILVDGEKYIVQFYSPTFGLTLYAKLIKLLGDPLIKLLSTFKGKDIKTLKAEDVDFDSAGDAIQSLFSNLPIEQFVPLLKEILSCTFSSPTLMLVTEDFDARFIGKYNHVFRLVAKTLGAQYPDFLSVIGKRLSAVRGAPDSEKKAGA